jgi:dienelactone hydrolase
MSLVSRFSLVMLIAVLRLALFVSASAQAPDPQPIAQAVIDNLVAGNYEAATADFTDEMLAALPPAKLQQVWESVIDQVGPYQRQVEVTSQTAEGYTVFIFTLQFENALSDAQISISTDGKVGGLHIRPNQGSPPPPYEAPDYVNPDAFTEQDITLNAGTEWELPGTLSLPVGDGPFPAVVLVHGSGPEDRDETIGANKPFRDLAWGLASQGIAVLRYDKRTLVYAQAMKDQIQSLTVQDETIDDALAAVELLRSTDKIDPARVLLAGHSLGGYLAPRIASQTSDLAGIIILSGNARPLDVLLVEQVKYLLSLKPEMSDADRAQLESIEADAEALKNLDASTDPSTTYLGVPAVYWLDLKHYDPVTTAQTLTLPVLILQGGRDYQVTMTDFKVWQDGLAGHDNVTFISYPTLNHLLFSGEGPSTPAEYNQPGHVAPQLIQDVANWILQR